MKSKLSKIVLEKLYYDEKKSMKEISLELNCGETTVHHYMNIHNLPRRSRSDARIGYKHSWETKQKLADTKKKSDSWLGENNPNWRGGISKIKYDRAVTGIRHWAKSVKRRDKMICQWCGIDGSKECECCGSKPKMHSHHIKSWNDYPDLRLDVENGITLCEKCHRSTIGQQGELLETPTGTISSQAS